MKKLYIQISLMEDHKFIEQPIITHNLDASDHYDQLCNAQRVIAQMVEALFDRMEKRDAANSGGQHRQVEPPVPAVPGPSNGSNGGRV